MVFPILHKMVISPIAVEEKNVIMVEVGILGFNHDRSVRRERKKLTFLSISEFGVSKFGMLSYKSFTII